MSTSVRGQEHPRTKSSSAWGGGGKGASGREEGAAVRDTLAPAGGGGHAEVRGWGAHAQRKRQTKRQTETESEMEMEMEMETETETPPARVSLKEGKGRAGKEGLKKAWHQTHARTQTHRRISHTMRVQGVFCEREEGLKTSAWRANGGMTGGRASKGAPRPAGRGCRRGGA